MTIKDWKIINEDVKVIQEQITWMINNEQDNMRKAVEMVLRERTRNLFESMTGLEITATKEY